MGKVAIAILCVLAAGCGGGGTAPQALSADDAAYQQKLQELFLDAKPGSVIEIPAGRHALDRVLSEVKSAYPQYQLWMEPGRYLVADAGVLLARVTQQKGKAQLRYLGIDTGMNSLIRPALYDAWHEIVNLTRLDEPATALFQIVGPICESGDVLGTDRRLPEAQEGDVMLIAQAGAYGKVMSSHYNLRDEADEVIIDA